MLERLSNTPSGFKKGKVTCPICGRTHRYHCSISADEQVVLCKYRYSDRQAIDGRYIHFLTSVANRKLSAFSATPIGGSVKCGSKPADADRCNEVLRAFLEHPLLVDSDGKNPPLKADHADHLLNERGLSDTTIAANLYTSVPEQTIVKEICDDLASKFDLKGIAGFYRKDGNWRLNLWGDGLLIPYKDSRCRIVAAQIRRFDRMPKYIWLSSKDKEGGASSGSPLHFSRPDLIKHTGSAFFTEGALKADRISEFTHTACIAAAGVSAFDPAKLRVELREAFPDLKELIVVYDMDWQVKTEVKKALFKLLTAFKNSGVKVVVRTWDLNSAKGFDDALAITEGI